MDGYVLMEVGKQAAGLQLQALSKVELLKNLIGALRRQSKRMLLWITRYTSQTSSEGLLGKLEKDYLSFKDIEEYSDLLSQQFCGRLEDLHKRMVALKADVEKFANDVRNRPADNHADRLGKTRAALEGIDKELAQIWKRQHFLVLNYRLDISAKEIERWTSILNLHRCKPEAIEKAVDSLFS